MNIDIASNCLVISGRQGLILKVDFAAPLDELSIRRHRKELRAVHRNAARQERDLDMIMMGLDQVLSSFFIADDHTHPVRVLNGLTLTAIVARKAPPELGGLGLDVYGRVLRELVSQGAFRQPLEGYPALEALFADKVVDVIETVAADRQKRGVLEKVDEVFYTMSTGRLLSADRVNSSLSLVQSASRLEVLEQNVEKLGNIFSGSKGTAGSYVDFNDRARSVPNLSAVTIQGIASAPAVLEAANAAAIDYDQVARAAAAHRRNLRLGGRSITAESAEFHVRIFRAIGLTAADLGELSAESLKALVQKAIDLHALSCEPEAQAA